VIRPSPAAILLILISGLGGSDNSVVVIKEDGFMVEWYVGPERTEPRQMPNHHNGRQWPELMSVDHATNANFAETGEGIRTASRFQQNGTLILKSKFHGAHQEIKWQALLRCLDHIPGSTKRAYNPYSDRPHKAILGKLFVAFLCRLGNCPDCFRYQDGIQSPLICCRR
jgi:hypothetical protein